MKIDGYEIESEALEKLIEKICEADGSPQNKVSYLAEAAKLLVYAIEEITMESIDET